MACTPSTFSGYQGGEGLVQRENRVDPGWSAASNSGRNRSCSTGRGELFSPFLTPLLARVSLTETFMVSSQLPIAAHVASPPPSIFPQDESEIPPTPFIRASSSDNRASLSHPLRHATLSCISQIASIRNKPLAPDEAPTRNGADYLLTSLTMFITHEPCVLCSMSLVHSRVREVVFVYPSSAGGFSTKVGVHGHRSLNHQFKVYRAEDVEVTEEERRLLRLPEGMCA